MLHQALRHDRGDDLALPPSLNPANFGDNAATSLLPSTARAKTPIARIGGIRQAETHPRFPRAPRCCARSCAMDDEADEATLARIYSRDDQKDDYAALEIDAVLQSRSQSKRLPLIRPLAEAKFLTRRAMEVGFYEVLKIRQNSRSESDAGFESLEDNAKEASKAIGKVLRSLDPSAKTGAEFERAIVTTLGGIPGVVDAGALHCLARRIAPARVLIYRAPRHLAGRVQRHCGSRPQQGAVLPGHHRSDGHAGRAGWHHRQGRRGEAPAPR